MAEVTTTLAAEEDLESHFDHFLNFSERTAAKFKSSIQSAYSRLAMFPRSGSLVHRRLSGIRFVLVPKFRRYLIIYRVRKSTVEILRVLHGSRNVFELLADDLRNS